MDWLRRFAGIPRFSPSKPGIPQMTGASTTPVPSASCVR
jgi:hypothetical protein